VADLVLLLTAGAFGLFARWSADRWCQSGEGPAPGFATSYCSRAHAHSGWILFLGIALGAAVLIRLLGRRTRYARRIAFGLLVAALIANTIFVFSLTSVQSG
jgi:hypothetical protein